MSESLKAEIFSVDLYRLSLKSNNSGVIQFDPGPGGRISVSQKRITELNNPINNRDAVNLQFLLEKLSSIGNLGDVDFQETPEDGSILIYNANSGSFQPSIILQKQIIDGGIY